MYHEHFRLAAEPFSLTPDPAFLFLGRQHREALGAIEYGIRAGRGFVSLIGEVGTGKTTVVYSLSSRLQEEASIAYVSTPARAFSDLLRCALKDFGLPVPAGNDRLAMLETLNAHLLRMADGGRPVALIIDEAQNLSDETFEALRMLSNFETYTRKLLQIVLVGQPELGERLAQPRLRQLRDRISVRATLAPLRLDELREYVGYRLARVGGTLDLFEPRALRLLLRHCDGIPRRANILCHNALLFAYGRQLDRVTLGVAREAVAEARGCHGPHLVPLVRRWWLAASGGAVAMAALMVGFGWRTEGMPEPPAWPPVPLPVAPETVAQEPELARPDTGTDDLVRDPVMLPPAAQSPAAAPAGTVQPTEPPPLEVVVSAGSTVLRLAREAYGHPVDVRLQPRFLEAVRRLNPTLEDLDLVRPGDRLRLPATPQDTAWERSG